LIFKSFQNIKIKIILFSENFFILDHDPKITDVERGEDIKLRECFVIFCEKGVMIAAHKKEQFIPLFDQFIQ
jgi:hypothetical protein